MYDQLLQLLTGKNIDLTITQGVFLTARDTNNQVLVSQGVLQSDKPLSESLQLLYNAYIQSRNDIAELTCELVHDIRPLPLQDLLAMDTARYGVCVVNDEQGKSGVILPNTPGITTMKQALTQIQQKYHVTGQAHAYVFETIVYQIPPTT